MADYRKTPDDHFMALLLLESGLQQADALKIFLIALAGTIRSLDASDDCTPRQTRFLSILDDHLRENHKNVGSAPAAVKATDDFRRVLDQHLDEMQMFARPPN